MSIRTFRYSAFPFRKQLRCKVISVGNITLGGTGKTPVVIAVASTLQRLGKRPAVVSRGYGRQDESLIRIVSDGEKIDFDTTTNGDEPVLIAKRLPGIPVIAGKDRYQASKTALARFELDAVVLDDGFQHQSLRRDLDIVLIDAADPFGRGRLFPAGILREPVRALKRADIILITRSDRIADVEKLVIMLQRWTKAPIFTSSHVPAGYVNSMTGETRDLSSMHGARAFVFSGIGKPGSFHSLLESQGVNIVAATNYPDHYQYTKKDLADIRRHASEAGADMILTTEKDSVRLASLKPEGIWALSIDLKIREFEAWERMLCEQV